MKKIILAGLLTIAAAGCSGPIMMDTLPYSPDYKDRHKISLQNEETVFNVYPVGQLDLPITQQRQINAVSRTYLNQGKGYIYILSPYREGENNYAIEQKRGKIIRQIMSNGVSPKVIMTENYPENKMIGVNPIKIKFTKLKAGLSHGCDKWLTDLGNTDAAINMENISYWNLGCATQQSLAASVANPTDLFEPVAEESPSPSRADNTFKSYSSGDAPKISSGSSGSGSGTSSGTSSGTTN